MKHVTVRWMDGYLVVFVCEKVEVRTAEGMLWMLLKGGENRNIPLKQIRWFGVGDEAPEEMEP